MTGNLDNLFGDFNDGDSPTGEAGNLEDRMSKIEKTLVLLAKGLKGKDKYPYPEGAPNPKDKEEDEEKAAEQLKKITQLEADKEELTKKIAELTKSLEEYSSKEKTEAINDLVNLELEKKLYTKEKGVDIAKDYAKLSIESIGVLKSRVGTIDLEGKAGKQTTKALELKKQEEDKKIKAVESLNEKIKTYEDANLSTKDLKKELKALETDGE